MSDVLLIGKLYPKTNKIPTVPLWHLVKTRCYYHILFVSLKTNKLNLCY